MKLKIYPKSPAPRHITQVVDVLNDGGLIIIPTDGVYAIACAANQPEAIKKMAELKRTTIDKSNFSFLFADLGSVSEYSKPINKDHYKVMNWLLPGPFTFILQANGLVNKIFPGRKTIGIRIPNNNIPLNIIEELGQPLLTTSVHDEDEILEYTTDPEIINRDWEDKIDLIIDGGFGHNEPSTVLDCTDEGITMIRQGIGDIEEVMTDPDLLIKS